MKETLMIVIAILIIGSMSACSTYREPGYNPADASHQSEGVYSDQQYRADSNRADVTAQRQREYDRHQDAVQRRAQSGNREMRNNVGMGALVVGGGLLIRDQLIH